MSSQVEKVSEEYKISDVVQNEYRDFAMYTVSDRAIPSLMDGLKNVQRFYLYSSLTNSKNKYGKVSAIGGVVSDYGYNHGELSAMEAGQLMAADWSNNFTLIHGEGSFGSRLVPVPAAPRYTFTKIHDNFFDMFKDFEHCPEHHDFEHLPPKFYLPILPVVLLNGARGIATGFAVNILPRDPKQVKAAMKKVLAGKKLKPNSIKPKYPKCSNNISYNGEKWVEVAPIEKVSATKIIINDVLYKYSREKYIKLLDNLEDNKEIVSYKDFCSEKGFKFEISLKRGTKYSDEKLNKMFNLTTTHVENINLLDENGQLISFDCVEDVLTYFVSIKTGYVEKRIESEIVKYTEKNRYAGVLISYVENILDENIVFKRGKKQAAIIVDIHKHVKNVKKEDIDKLTKMPMTSLTDEKVKVLKKYVKDNKALLKYWENTSISEQYSEDLESLIV